MKESCFYQTLSNEVKRYRERPRYLECLLQDSRRDSSSLDSLNKHEADKSRDHYSNRAINTFRSCVVVGNALALGCLLYDPTIVENIYFDFVMGINNFVGFFAFLPLIRSSPSKK